MALLCFVEKNCSIESVKIYVESMAEEYLNENKIDRIVYAIREIWGKMDWKCTIQ